MSRARPCKDGNGDLLFWRDSKRDGKAATDEQVELLATLETDCELDDLLDEALTQGQVIERIDLAFGRNPLPIAIVEKRQKWRDQRRNQPQCRICLKEGDSTKHHFVNKWILRELEFYSQRWADTRINTIPVCISCHRRLHARDDSEKSIAAYLNDKEKDFAHQAIKALLHEHPAIFELQVLGDEAVYEARLVQDWCNRAFLVTEKSELVKVAA